MAEKGDFVIDLVNIQNNVHLAVDINRFNELVAISHIYNVFRVTNSELMKEYLLIMFKNSKIEKWLKWVCHGSIRGTLSWDNFIKFPISLPPLEVQKRIVNNYETLGKIIQFKKKINELLEEWMQCLFHSMFDDLEEFTHETFGNLFQIIKGSRPPRSNYYWDKLYYCRAGGVPFLQVKDISKSKCKFLVSTLEQLTEEGLKKCRGILLGGGTSFFVITELPKQLKI
ncbi:hypothetical protein OVS_02050 [Mycoplasma ovis str. Michigan]|uniref:Type I restriction modification DNA specificity domain-containing protein n=1 Tax=Mycoplasma ovis str. Michigan TaxID=1415773 RepID=A0ABN4BKV5_9MOLU|nr:hypothetical protein OVS_02050 [Mycoplasma ovis str. Michigan]